MAGYFDYQGVNSGHLEAGPSSFVRPLNLSDRKSGNTSHPSRTSGASGLTYATNGSVSVPDEAQQSPAEPIMGVPTPVMPPKGLQLPGEVEYEDEDEEEEDDDPEYMMVDADLSMVSQFGAQPPSVQQNPSLHNKPVPVKVQGGRKGFVGGFVSGLRRLPRMMLRNRRGQTVYRQPSHDTVSELPGIGFGGEDSAGDDPFRARPPFISHHVPPTPRHPPSIPASHPVTSMHYSHYTHDERSETPTSRDPRDFDDEELDHGHSGSDEDDDQPSIHKPLSTIAHSTHQSTHHSANHSTHHSANHSTHHSVNHSTHHSANHSTHHSNHPSAHKSNPNSGYQSDRPSTDPPTPHRSTTPSRQTALDGDTTLNHQTQNGESKVVVANPLPTSDYKSMGPEPSSSSSSTPSIMSNVNRLQKFVNDVYNLPWVATRVAVDYFPERDGRMYHGMDPDAKRPPKPLKSWYPPTHQDLDLLAEPSPPQSAPVTAHRRKDGRRHPLTESTISPASAGITQSVITTPSTTYSTPHRHSVTSEPGPRHARHTRDFRHTHRNRRRHRDHSRPHSPPIYPVLASPQPLYLYPGHASPPVMPIPQPALGSSPSSPRSRRGVTSPAMPIFMISVPPPVYQPMTGFPYATPQLTQSQPAQSQPAQSQSVQSQPVQSQPVQPQPQPATNPPAGG